jgi:hypothetical protein
MMAVRGKADAGGFLVVASRFLFPENVRDAVITRRSAPSLCTSQANRIGYLFDAQWGQHPPATF